MKIKDIATQTELESLSADGIGPNAHIDDVIPGEGTKYALVKDSNYDDCVIRLHIDAPPVVECLDSLSDQTRIDCARWLKP